MSPVAGMAQVFESLLARAHVEAEQVIAAARSEAERISTAAQATIELRRAREIDQRDTALLRRSADAVAAARKESAARTLAARHELVERVLVAAEARARTLLLTAPVLQQLLDEACEYLGDACPTIRCAPPFAPAVRDLVAARGGGDVVDDRTVAPGLIAESPDGAVVVENTVLSRIAQRRRELAALIVSQVEEGG